MNYSSEIVIDPEFQALIPPLSQEEYAQLEQNILAEGCLDALVVWEPVPFGDEILLDGHNRYAICRKHDYEFCTQRIGPNTIPDRAATMAWIVKNQLGRRNLNESQRAMCAARLKSVYEEQAKERLKASGGDKKSYDAIVSKELKSGKVNWPYPSEPGQRGVPDDDVPQPRYVTVQMPFMVKVPFREGFVL